MNLLLAAMMRYFKTFVFLSAAACFAEVNAFGETGAVLKRIEATGAARAVPDLMALGGEVEPLWPNQPALYFQACDQLGAVLEPLSATNTEAREELERECGRSLARRCPTNLATADLCLRSKSQIAERFAERFQPPSAQHAEILANFLGEVRAMMITNYHPFTTYLNIGPPIQPMNSNGVASFAFSGMNPKAIRDPIAKAAYEQAIAENGEHGLENTLQTLTLPELNCHLTWLFVGYTKGVFAKDPRSTNQAAALAKTARLTAEKESVMRSPGPSPGVIWYMQHSPR
jgi:hypothetical protein